MDLITLLGLTAACFTTLAFLPQVIKTWRAKSAEDLSLGTFVLFCVGIVLWLIYGLLIGDVPIIAANVVALGLAGTLLVLALRYRSARFEPSDSDDHDYTG